MKKTSLFDLLTACSPRKLVSQEDRVIVNSEGHFIQNCYFPGIKNIKSSVCVKSISVRFTLPPHIIEYVRLYVLPLGVEYFGFNPQSYCNDDIFQFKLKSGLPCSVLN